MPESPGAAVDVLVTVGDVDADQHVARFQASEITFPNRPVHLKVAVVARGSSRAVLDYFADRIVICRGKGEAITMRLYGASPQRTRCTEFDNHPGIQSARG